MNPESALYQLLLSLFAADELRRWLRYDPVLTEIVAELPGDTAAPTALVGAVVERLVSRGLVDDHFFARLREERPRRVSEIERVVALWSEEPVKQPPPRPKDEPPQAAPSPPPRSGPLVNEAVSPSDVAILVALKEEWQILWEIAGKPRGVKDPESGRVLFRFEVPSEVGRAYRCAGLFIGEMGPGQAVNAAMPLLRGRPRTLVNVGIAAAIHDDLRLCDVVVADQVDDYFATVKAVTRDSTSWEFELRGSVYKATHSLVQDVDSLEYADNAAFERWRSACLAAAAARPEFAAPLAKAIRAKLVREAPAIVRVHLASGSVLSAAEAFSHWIRKRDGLLKALEMEAAGMMLAAHHQGEPTPTLVLRGISDFGDSRKAKTDKRGGGAFRHGAMTNATQLLWTLMRQGILPRHDDGGFQARPTEPPPTARDPGDPPAEDRNDKPDQRGRGPAAESAPARPKPQGEPPAEEVNPSVVPNKSARPTQPAAVTTPATTPTRHPLRVFIAYSKTDQDLLDELKVQLSGMKRSGVLDFWTDQQLIAGQQWDEAIREKLAAAEIILLLVSADFIATDYCWRVELPTALERRARGEAIVVPIILRPCDWQEVVLPLPDDAPSSVLGDIAALPPNGTPIQDRRWHSRDEAWMAVVKGLRALIDDRQRGGGGSAAPGTGGARGGSGPTRGESPWWRGATSSVDSGRRSRPREPWDAVPLIARILHDGPRRAVEKLDPRLPGRPPTLDESDLDAARRVAKKIDDLGDGLGAAQVLIKACDVALGEVKRGYPGEYRATRAMICKLLAEWMPRRYDGEGVLVLETAHDEFAEATPDLEVRTVSRLMSAFHVAGANGQPAEIDGKHLRGRGSIDLPEAVLAEMLDVEQIADKIAGDIIGEDPSYQYEAEDSREGRRDFARLRIKRQREGFERKPRDITLRADRWAALVPEDARRRLKVLFPALCQVTLTRPPGPEEAEIVQILIDIYKGHDDDGQHPAS